MQNFCDLKKDISLKQRRLYELKPVLDSPKDTIKYEQIDRIECEILHDEEAIEVSEHLENVQSTHEEVGRISSPKHVRRKQKLSQSNEKLRCNICGRFLSNNGSLKRHTDRVG